MPEPGGAGSKDFFESLRMLFLLSTHGDYFTWFIWF